MDNVCGPWARQTDSSPSYHSRTSLGGKTLSCAMRGDFFGGGVCVEGYDNKEPSVLCLFGEEVNG